MTGVFGVVLGQILLMFLYLIIGYVLYRTGLITQEGSKALAHLLLYCCLLYTSPSPRDGATSRMPSSA